MIDHIDLVYAEIETELLEPIWPGTICEENQTRQRRDKSYKRDLGQKNDTELLWSIGLGAEYKENQIRQLCDWLYKCGLCWKWTWAVITDRTSSSLWQKSDRTATWPIV